MFRTRALIAAVAAVASLSAFAPAATVVQWTTGTGANNHYYERVDITGLTFTQSKAAAAAMTYLGLPGHLVIFDGATLAAYQPEFNFVDANVYAPSVTESHSYYVGADSPSGNSGTYTWVDGSPVPSDVSASWNIDHNEAPPEAATFFQTVSHKLWDYSDADSLGYASGYIVEFEPASGTTVPLPSSALAGLSLLPLLALTRLRLRQT